MSNGTGALFSAEAGADERNCLTFTPFGVGLAALAWILWRWVTRRA